MFKKITLSGAICTGKSTVFKILQEKSGWPSFSAGQFFRHYCQKHHLTLWQAEKRPVALTKKVDLGMRERLKKPGHLILEGWMAGLMAQGIPGVLKVLFVVDDQKRIKRFARRENLSEEEGEKQLFRREKNFLGKLKKVYQREDFLDPRNYDLVVNTTDLTGSETTKKILEKIGDKD